MKQTVYLLILLLCSLLSYSQTNWVYKELDANVQIKFPQEPNYDSKPERGLKIYAIRPSKLGCMFTVVVRSNAMPNYAEFLKLSASEQSVKVNGFLDRGIDQFIQRGKVLSPKSVFEVGGYHGKEVTYIQPESSNLSSTQFTKFLLVKNTLFIIQVSSPANSRCSYDKDYFFNSLTVK